MSKISEIRALSLDEISARLRELKQEGLNLRIQQSTSQLENSARIRQIRREIAQVNTIAREKAKAAQ